jgi:hypothetical protein
VETEGAWFDRVMIHNSREWPVPVGLGMLWTSLSTVISCPIAMPTGSVAPKPVPVTVTCAPEFCVVGFSVIDPAAATIEAVANNSVNSNVVHVIINFVLIFILISPKDVDFFIVWLVYNNFCFLSQIT